MQRRQFLRTATAGAAALAAPRIGRAAGAAALRFVPQADLAVLDPVFTTAYVTRNHAFMVFDTLYGIDSDFNPQPQMVAGHTVENDGKLWTLTLRDGLRFHDNTPVRSRDALASIRRWMQRDAFGASLMAAIDEMTAPTDKKLQIKLKAPFPMLPLAMGHGSNTMLPIMPERLANTPPSQAVTDMVGSGPYRFIASERVAGSLAVYERFDGYVPRASGEPSFTAGPKIASVERVEWHTIPDPATAAAALQAGEIDWWENPTSDLLPLLKKNSAIVTEILDTAGNIGFLRVNSLLPPFDNPAIKHALLGAINQTDFMQAVVGDDPAMYHVKAGVFTPGTPLATDVGLNVFPDGAPDYAKVQQALKAAGYKGEKVTFIAASDFPAINALCEVSADMFKRAGFNLDYQSTDWGSVTQRRNNQGPPAQGGWNAHCTYTAGYDLLTPATNPSLNAIGKAGFVGWPTDPKLAALRTAWFNAPDLTAQKAICRDIQTQFWQDPPYVPLGQFFLSTAYRRTLSGILKGSFTLFWNVVKA
ncbi:MAG TPA: ABC transporter substrate-binding protein [Rhodopila sp.]|uniref:ABC transporter substrate-binding protein n=1 Tax=Rhodopila sp. TaxID=2480087 RepID=UPI002BDC8340|nr:ABC transporter substrate-binding protein [Rhodopila sp.]HVY14601.1 ABC transporter substrate-binding protein [Rhodopila sp.]